MTGVEEAALVSAVAPELLTAAGGTLGAEIGGMTAASALPFIGEVGPAAAGLGWATGAGEALGGGLGAAFGMPETVALAAPEAAGMGELLGNFGTLTNQGLLGASAYGMPGLTQGLMTGPVVPFAPGAVTSAPGAAAAFGPTTAQAASKPWLTGDKAMQLAKMAGAIGGGGGEQQPLGSPPDFSNPMQRPGLLTQEQITKKWLLENDPNTYRRLYGEPKGVA